MAERALVKGDHVKLRDDLNHQTPDGRRHHHTAHVRAVYGVDSGEVWLDQQLGGSVYWNQSDLELVED
ncbi:hypothetical protein D3C75_838020 [compost metagenome]